MRNGFPAREIVNRLKERFPAGTRVELVQMNDPYTRIEPGTRGTVVAVDDIGTIHVNWDNGCRLGAAYRVDTVRKVI